MIAVTPRSDLRHRTNRNFHRAQTKMICRRNGPSEHSGSPRRAGIRVRVARRPIDVAAMPKTELH